MRCGTSVELTLETGETKTADARLGPLAVDAGPVVCWSLVVRPCWAYAARTRAVSLGACATEVAVRVGRVRGALTMRAPGRWELEARCALAGRGRAHAERALFLLATSATSMRALPPEILRHIAAHLAAMCELSPH
jgi:hypothetical protein